MSSLLDRMKATMQLVLDGYERWEVEAVMAPRAGNCTHQILPKSLGRQPQNNTEYRQYFATVTPLFKDFKITVDREVWDVNNRKAALHLYSTATSPIGPYKNEYSFFADFNEDGTKVTRLEEMVDSGLASPFFAKLMEHVKTSGGDGSEEWRKAVEAANDRLNSGKQ